MNALHSEPHVALVVEDEPYVRELAGALLEETELDVVGVTEPRRPWPTSRTRAARSR